jgi:hypothetical protein
MRVFMIGDIVGLAGCKAVDTILPKLKKQYQIQQIIANAENAWRGKGLNRQTADDLFSSGIHILTSGNHIWDQREVFEFIDTEDRIIRPANYPDNTPGKGWTTTWAGSSGIPYAVINLLGRAFISELDCPFRTLDRILAEIPKEIKIRIVDFHGEATSEKMAFAHYAKGRVSAVLGTHTHVQTADEQILPEGTGYITDVGMTGAFQSILGVETEAVLHRFLTHLPTRFTPAEGPGQMDGVLLDIDDQTGKTTSIERIQWREKIL